LQKSATQLSSLISGQFPSVFSFILAIFERFIVNNFIIPVIPPADIRDQFAFRPTGSPADALIYTLHHVTRMLDDNNYVRCILLDFTKAFDTINHVVIFSKLKKLPMHVHPVIFSGLVNFVTGRTQGVSLNISVSEFPDINQSIVGPVLYSFCFGPAYFV